MTNGKQDDTQLEIRKLLEEYRIPRHPEDKPWVDLYTEKFATLFTTAQLQLVSDPNTPALVAARKQGYDAGLSQGHTDCENQGERNDLIATDSSQDTDTPSRPGEHKKQELKRGSENGRI